MPEQNSILSLLLNAAGFYGFFVVGVGLLVFVLAGVIVFLNRRPAVIATYLVAVPLPMMFAGLGSMYGLLTALVAMASPEVMPSEVATGAMGAIVMIMVGLIVTLPTMFVIGCGLFFRTLFDRNSATS